MKLASLKQGRDGQLVVVNSALSKMVKATDIAPTMQAALDDWANIEPKLQALFTQLEKGEVEGEDFVQSDCHSPLPRAY